MAATAKDDTLVTRALGWLLPGSLLVACVKGFYDVAASYNDFLLPQQGTRTIPETELAFYAYYALLGVIAAVALAQLLAKVGSERRLATLFDKLCADPRRLVFALALLSFGLSFAFRRLVLASQPIADDEATYLFIARTLLSGGLSNAPPEDPDFFRNQFVVLNDHAWFGKYPIGHPLWLALGELLHLRDIVSPLAGALCVPLTYAIGSRVFEPKRALLGTLLLVASPHFVWTCGTLLSQPTAALALLLGTLLLLRAQERPNIARGALAGLVFGFGLLVRPMPGALFAAVAATVLGLSALRSPGGERARRWLAGLAFAVVCALGVIALAAVNHAQTGDIFTTGYHEIHGQVPVFANGRYDLANSLFGALLRENFWLFGVPGSLLLVVWARPLRNAALFWGLIAAELLYRLVSPKTVVATTGPIYLTEIVPLLTLAAAAGLARLRTTVSQWPGRTGPATLVLAALLVAAGLFVPIELATVRRAATQRALVFDALERTHVTRALVFADALVWPGSGVSWAYFPDNPSPSLEDDILFVRVPHRDRDPLAGARAFWQRRFADRRAFMLLWSSKGEPEFQELQPR